LAFQAKLKSDTPFLSYLQKTIFNIKYRKNYAFPLLKCTEWAKDHFGVGFM